MSRHLRLLVRDYRLRLHIWLRRTAFHRRMPHGASTVCDELCVDMLQRVICFHSMGDARVESAHVDGGEGNPYPSLHLIRGELP